MATQRKKRKRPAKLKVRTTRPQNDRDRALATAGLIGLYVLSKPELLRGAGAVLEVLGRAMQRTADSAETTAPTQLPPGDVLDLSAFRERKKGPSDGKEGL